MEHTLNFVTNFASTNTESPKHDRLRSIHFDHSGHVVATNSHVLFATKNPFEMSRANKTFLSDKAKTGELIEASIEFPDWKKILPLKSARKVILEIPTWFASLETTEEKVTMILDYTDSSNAFIKIGNTINETSLAFNAKYMSKFAGERLAILISSPEQPTVILSSSSKIDPHSPKLSEDILHEDWFYLLMPIKLEENKINSKVYI
ncbi:hypothetical protein [Halobacteriovorax sp. HLS]|uniref:hypothetical protein n=1 Tax=Halobacteriovorax sp. HLS TaxID=2234000 RepID=UPI000FDA5531|nr:hypothetical protein [Halobacteriovorax sp. HLS]